MDLFNRKKVKQLQSDLQAEQASKAVWIEKYKVLNEKYYATKATMDSLFRQNVELKKKQNA